MEHCLQDDYRLRNRLDTNIKFLDDEDSEGVYIKSCFIFLSYATTYIVVIFVVVVDFAYRRRRCLLLLLLFLFIVITEHLRLIVIEVCAAL